ncbi:hypothetical protein RJ641_010251 [Dillenia turbinata]|uniref:Uncharacterized protein n=1 Tax=Dillenia turbinata TaxID=194707 RepID=A0AAN8V5Q8_9MAGN
MFGELRLRNRPKLRNLRFQWQHSTAMRSNPTYQSYF